MPSVLLFGPTGQLGSHLVVALKKTHPNLPLTIYLRNDKIDDYFTSTVGVDKIVHGNYSEHEKISTLVREHDLVINIGSSWDVGLSEAIIAGLRRRPAEATKILIHISGAGNFIDESRNGDFNPSAKVWNDDDEEDMKLINPTMLNGGPDTIILEAGKSGDIATYIIVPSGAYGASTGPVQALGVIQYLMAEKAKELGFVPYIGSGSTVFNTIHAQDIHPFIIKIMDYAMTHKVEGSVYSRVYIIGSNENTWKDLSTAFAQVFHSKGLISSPEPKSIKLEEAGSGEVPNLMAANVLIKGDRAARFGFKPVQPSLLEHLHTALDQYDF